MKTILISLLGKGSIKNNNEGNGYIKVTYSFDDGRFKHNTAFFGSALYLYLKNKGHDIERWLIFGTETSMWSEIIEAVEKKRQEKYEEIYCIVNEEEKKGISSDTLLKWQNCLCESVPGTNLIKVDAMDYKIYINKLLEIIPEDEEYTIVFDMTHAFRHMSVLMSFSLMYLKYFKKIKDIEVYYGALDMSPQNDPEKKALKIDFINELFALSTSYDIFNNSGYFPSILDKLSIPGTQSTYFKIEMNRNLKDELKEIIQKLDSLDNCDKYIRETATKIKEPIKAMYELKYLDEKMAERAKFFFEKKQYLKSLILIFEALKIVAARKLGIRDYDSHAARDEAKEKIKYEISNSNINPVIITEPWMGKVFNSLEYTRNSAAHGSSAKCVQEYVEIYEDFNKLFKDSLNMYEKIRNSK